MEFGQPKQEKPKEISPLEQKKKEATEAFKELGDFASGEVGNYIAGLNRHVLESDPGSDDRFMEIFGLELKQRFRRIRRLKEEVHTLDRQTSP